VSLWLAPSILTVGIVVTYVVNTRRRRRQLPNTSADLSGISRKCDSDTGELDNQ
jgi:cytochrome c-type biogenesis protein CcmH/NrfF